MAGQGEKNVVGDQKNWEDRVRTELESSKAWAENWGSLYEGAKSIDEQIISLEEKVANMPGQPGMKTNSQLSYEGKEPFAEHPVGNQVKRSLRMEEVEQLADEMLARQAAGAVLR